MSILADHQIEHAVKMSKMCPGVKGLIIEPYAPMQSRPGVISYGTTSYGYDVRVGYKFKIFTPVFNCVVDPKNLDPKCFVDIDLTPNTVEEVTKENFVLIPPNSFALAETVEYFEIPRDVLTICLGKSTYARCSIIVNVTPLEPEWKGKITIEISNTSPLPVKIYAGEGIAQIIFLKADPDNLCAVSYADKKGKYQNQTGLTLPKV